MTKYTTFANIDTHEMDFSPVRFVAPAPLRKLIYPQDSLGLKFISLRNVLHQKLPCFTIQFSLIDISDS